MINAKEFINALDELEATKGVSKDSILAALKEALEKAFRKQLGAAEDALVRVDIDPLKGTIEMYHMKNVVEEVQDDFLEISLEDAHKTDKKLKVGDIWQVAVPTDELTKLAALNVKSVLRQKISEAEKAALYEAFKDKIGEMVTGVVEKVDDKSTIVNIGRTSVYLPNSHKIPSEVFKPGDTIKLYVADVVSTTKGAQIAVSRTDPGFLKRLFEEEIHEIYDGTVVIKDIAREAGERSKIAVLSTDENVDASGACIGPNGSRIQKIVAQLGGAGKDKEKIDIIAYNPNIGVYIIEALKPATVLGVVLEEGKKSATAVVANGQLSLAIGKRGVNARLAVKLTGYNIDIKEQDEAMRLGLKPLNVEELRRDEAAKKHAADEQAYIDSIAPTPKDIIPETPVAVVTAAQPLEAPKAAEVATPAEKPVEVAPAPVAKSVEQPKVETHANVRTTKTLQDLEKQLEEEKVRAKRNAEREKLDPRKKFYKKSDETKFERPVETKEPIKPLTLDESKFMKIYTPEELKALEDEETNVNAKEKEDEVDYDAFDKYYEDEVK
ncbi:MAG: transcription termination factor NusA [Firmicutes bacterium]|nr:transcription termination factor NusA [Bacillota bacterium]